MARRQARQARHGAHAERAPGLGARSQTREALPVAMVGRMDGPATDTRLQIDVSNLPALAGQQLWLALLSNGQLLFVGEREGLVVFQCPGTCDAPANRAATGSPQRIEYLHWDVRGLIGAKVYLGWGRSFAEMVDTGQMLEIHTVAPAP